MSVRDREGKVSEASFELSVELAFEQEAVADVDEDLSRDDLAMRRSGARGIWSFGAILVLWRWAKVILCGAEEAQWLQHNVQALSLI